LGISSKEPVLFSDFSYEKIEYIYNQRYDKEFLLWNPRLNRQLNLNTDLRKFILRLSEKTGIRIHAYRFRKTFGTMMYTESRDWRFTQKVLRHSDIRTTQIYVSESLEFVRGEYIKASKGFNKFKI
jgi:integrase